MADLYASDRDNFFQGYRHPGLVNGQRERDRTHLNLLWYVVMVLIAACAKLTAERVTPYATLTILLLVGWICGKISWFYDLTNDHQSDRQYCHIVIPLLLFVQTIEFDQHALFNSMYLILLVSVPVIFLGFSMIWFLCGAVAAKTFNWESRHVILISYVIGIPQVEHIITELGKLQSQNRVLQLILLGEKSIALLVSSSVFFISLAYEKQPNTKQFDYWVAVAAFAAMLVTMGLVTGLLFTILIKYFYKDIISQVNLFVGVIHLLFFVTKTYLGAGELAVLIFGITVGYMKIKYSSKAERFFLYFWRMVSFVGHSVVFTMSGYYIGNSPLTVPYIMNGYVYFGYVMLVVARAVGYMLIYRIINQLGTTISMKSLAIASLGVGRDPIGLVTGVAIMNLHNKYDIVLFTTGVYLLANVFSVMLFSQILQMFDMYEMSWSRILNMNVAMYQVNECREKCVRSLKMDRLVADSNWVVVEKVTRLVHPYAGVMVSKKDGVNDTQRMKSARILKCKACTLENEIPLMEAELAALLLDAKQRILKAQLVCFFKQYENGTLTRPGLSILTNLVENASVKDDPKLVYKDLRIQLEGSATMKCLKPTFGVLFTKTSVTHRFIPTNIIRALFFRLCTARMYQTIMAYLCLVDVIIISWIVQAYYFGEDLDQKNTYSMIVQGFDLLFFSICLFDFIANILGIGVVQFFTKGINQMEFAVGLLIRGNQLAMYTHTCHTQGDLVNVFFVKNTIIFQKVVMLIRICRIYLVFVTLIPKIMVMIDKKLDQDLVKSYDLGKAYLLSLKRVSYFLSHIADNEKVRSELLASIESERFTVTMQLGLIQKMRPSVASSNKTLHAIRHVLLIMEECISNMKEEGLLDTGENRSLVASINSVKRKLLRYTLVLPSLPHKILADLPWLCDEPDHVAYLAKHARMATFDKGEKIIYYKDEFTGLYIISSGVVKCSYIPSDKTIRRTQSDGILPNCDYYANLNFTVPHNELIVGGNVLGEIGAVTGRVYDMEATCETRVQLYEIPWTTMKVITQDTCNSAFVTAKLWKAVGMKIANHLLHATPRFRGWQDSRLLLYLQRGIVPLLDSVESLFINELVDDVILIEGKLMDLASKIVYTAPAWIPRTSSQRLVLPGTPLWNAKYLSEPKVLVIPNGETTLENIMSKEGLFKYSYQSKTGRCDQHISQKNVAKMVQAQRRKRKVTQFMDYMPTINGAIENVPVYSTYIEKHEKTKQILTGPHARIRTVQYTQDTEEQSEIELMKDEEEFDGEKRMSRKSFKKKDFKKSTGSLGDLMHYESTSHSIKNPSRTEIVVVEDRLRVLKLPNSKYSQSIIEMGHTSREQ